MLYGVQTYRTYQIQAAYVAWCVSKIKLRNGEVVDLGSSPSGGILFNEDEEPIGFRAYDGSEDYDLDEVRVVKDSDGRWYLLENYIEGGDFHSLLEPCEDE